MEYDANKYDNSNDIQMQTGLRIIRMIKNCYGDERIPIALDFGSGSGNLTETLFKSVDISRMYGIDIDKNMVDYGSDKHAIDGISYVQADFGSDIMHNQQLESLRGKVHLIFSNMALHWVKDKETLVRNIANLLVDQGQCFLYFMYKPSTSYTLINWLVRLSPERELNEWTKLFGDYGLDVIDGKLIEETITFDDNILRNHLEPLVWSFLKSKWYIPFTSMPQIMSRTLMWIGLKLFANIYQVTYDANQEQNIHQFKISLPFFRLIKH